MEREWAEFGITLSASGGVGGLPRLFDTTNPGGQNGNGDPDLGAPNEACPSGGPGKGVGGIPGMPGENCDPLGNILIVQEPGTDVPDDNGNGGMINFKFQNPAQYVYELGFLDIDYASKVEIFHETDTGMASTVFNLPLAGDNGKQTLTIDTENVREIKVTFSRSGAVTHISFCYNPGSGAPTPSTGPAPTPITGPAPTPGTGPAPTPEGLCSETKLTFDTTADGLPVKKGDYVGNEWQAFGLTLSASGGVNDKPRVFDTSDPVDGTCGDPDLGAPNMRCPGGGPGTGLGGEPDGKGPNCSPLGNALIVQEPGEDCPDDNLDGGMVVFDFEPMAE